MQKEPRKVREFRRREQEILDTALKLFLEQGEDSVTVEMIADAVGIGKGTIYKHFKSKAEIYLRLMLDYERDLNALLHSADVDRDKEAAISLGMELKDRGFEIVATGGTALALARGGVPCSRINKVREGRPHVVDMIKNHEISLIVNTTEGKQAIKESRSIRGEAVTRKVTYYTTVAAAKATCEAIDHLDNVIVNRLQDLHAEAPV